MKLERAINNGAEPNESKGDQINDLYSERGNENFSTNPTNADVVTVTSSTIPDERPNATTMIQEINERETVMNRRKMTRSDVFVRFVLLPITMVFLFITIVIRANYSGPSPACAPFSAMVGSTCLRIGNYSGILNLMTSSQTLWLRLSELGYVASQELLCQSPATRCYYISGSLFRVSSSSLSNEGDSNRRDPLEYHHSGDFLMSTKETSSALVPVISVDAWIVLDKDGIPLMREKQRCVRIRSMQVWIQPRIIPVDSTTDECLAAVGEREESVTQSGCSSTAPVDSTGSPTLTAESVSRASHSRHPRGLKIVPESMIGTIEVTGDLDAFGGTFCYRESEAKSYRDALIQALVGNFEEQNHPFSGRSMSGGGTVARRGSVHRVGQHAAVPGKRPLGGGSAGGQCTAVQGCHDGERDGFRPGSDFQEPADVAHDHHYHHQVKSDFRKGGAIPGAGLVQEMETSASAGGEGGDDSAASTMYTQFYQNQRQKQQQAQPVPTFQKLFFPSKSQPSPRTQNSHQYQSHHQSPNQVRYHHHNQNQNHNQKHRSMNQQNNQQQQRSMNQHHSTKKQGMMGAAPHADPQSATARHFAKREKAQQRRTRRNFGIFGRLAAWLVGN